MLLFFEFLLKVGLIPLHMNLSTNQLQFKMFSKSTLLFNFYCLILFGLANFFWWYMVTPTKVLEFWDGMYNQSETTDLLTFVVFFIQYAFPALNLNIYKDITKISNDLLFYKNLKWPKSGKFYIIMTSFGYIGIINWFIFMFKARVQEYYSTIGLICAVSFQFVYTFIVVFILMVFILSWMETLTMICKERNPARNIHQHSVKCRNYYKSMQDGLGRTFLLIFTTLQILIVIGLYKSITTAFYHPYDTASNIVLTVSYAVVSILNSTSLFVLTLAAEDAHTSLKNLVAPLNVALIGETEEKIQDIKCLIKEIENMPPLNGNGYFEIRKGTITSIVSTTVTYLIILLQFRSS